MNKFDVFINGIQQEHFDNEEQVKQMASDCLKIAVLHIEKLLNSPNTRIRQSVSEKKALQYQKVLHQIGIVCFYKPAAENTKNTSTYSCPNCGHQLTQTLQETPPEICDNCGIYIELFLEYKVPDDDKKQFHSVTPQDEKSTLTKESQPKINSAPQTLNLQKEIKNQQSSNEINKFKIPHLSLVLGTFAIVTLVSILYTSFFGKTQSEAKVTITEKITQSSGINKSIALQQAIESVDEKTVVLDESNKNTSLSETDLDSFNNLQITQQLQDDQNTLPETLDQNTNPFIEKTEPLHLQSSSPKKRESKKKTSYSKTNYLFSFAVDNHEWDNFLTQKIEDSIIDGNTERSHRLISCLSEPKKHISSLAKLLITTRQEKIKQELFSQMEDKIKSSPVEKQPQLFSQAGRYQIDSKLKKDLYNRADKILNTLSDPEQKLHAALGIAISYFKDGNIKLTNQYLIKITTLLPKINIADVDGQIKSRVAISRTYKDTGNINFALQWIKDSENLLNKADETTIRDLVEGYAYLEQHASVIRLAKKASSANQHDELMYSAVRVYLASGKTEHAIKLNKLMQGATYKALSYILIAAYSKEYQGYSTLAESVLNIEISVPIEKAIVSSRLAQLYARQYNIYKTEKQLQLTKQQMNIIPSSPKKDELLNIVATIYARSLMFKPATAFVSAIQSSDIQSQFHKEYSKLAAITAL